METRVKTLRESMESENLDAYLVANGVNMLYFSGFSGGSRLLIPKKEGGILYVPSVNYEAAKETVKNFDIELVNVTENADEKVVDRIRSLKIKQVGFDALDASIFLKLKEKIKDVTLKPMKKLVSELRKVKDEEEIDLIRKAASITSRGMEKAFEVIREGMSERELAAEIEYAMRKHGSDGVAFDTIVASGLSTAFPHGGCGDRRIESGDLVVIDIGAKYRGYCADLTRTLIVGESSSKQSMIYKTVKVAQEMAIQNLKANVKASHVDSVARDYIENKRYGEYFVHSLGHGVGLEIHELPNLSPKSQEPLKAGNVVTVEPGIYIVGFGGIRIEDTVLVLEDGAERLTEAPYDLTVS